MKTPEIDIEELNRLKEQNFQERLDFIRRYADWLKKNPEKAGQAQKKLHN